MVPPENCGCASIRLHNNATRPALQTDAAQTDANEWTRMMTLDDARSSSGSYFYSKWIEEKANILVVIKSLLEDPIPKK